VSGTVINTQQKGADAPALLMLQSPKLAQSLMKVLPAGLSADRFVRQAITLCRKTPGLLKCDPVSVVGGVVQAAELGLELSGPLGHCYLIPRRNNERRCEEAVFQMGYRGYKELAVRSGKVHGFTPRIIREKDDYKLRYGTEHKLEHTPSMAASEPIAYYCVAWMIGFHVPDFEFMSKEQVEDWKRKHVKAVGGRSPWQTHFDAMALKTVTGVLARRMPLTVQQQQAFEAEEAQPGESPSLTPAAADVLGAMGVEPVEGPLGPGDPGFAEGGPEPDAGE
jgi:recombination protein RecT